VIRNLICSFALLLSVSSCNVSGANEKTSEESGTPELPVIEIKLSNAVIDREYVADIHALQNIEVRAKVNGYLEQIHIDEGKDVKTGQLLFSINSDMYQTELNQFEAQLAQAQSEAKIARIEYENTKVLLEKGVVSQSELDLAQAKLEGQNARVKEAGAHRDLAAIKLGQTQIKAPFDGVIDRFPLKRGSLIEAGTLLTRISDVSKVHVYFNVSETEYLVFRSDGASSNGSPQKVELTLANGTDYEYEGVIETMEGEFDVNTGAISFRSVFPNPDKLLRHGSTGKIRMKLVQPAAILIPQRSVVEVLHKNYVYVVDPSGTVAQRPVKLGPRIGSDYLVLSGISEGELLVYEGIMGLKNGMRIKPRIISSTL
jgi:membrane fusion protein, multidrug efflux system